MLDMNLIQHTLNCGSQMYSHRSYSCILWSPHVQLQELLMHTMQLLFPHIQPPELLMHTIVHTCTATGDTHAYYVPSCTATGVIHAYHGSHMYSNKSYLCIQSTQKVFFDGVIKSTLIAV